MNREILIKWIDEALRLEPGESLFLHGETRDHCKALCRKFRNELKIIAELDPMKANKLMVVHTIKDGKYWVELKRIYGNPLVGFKKTKDGKVEKLSIDDPERRRRLLLMKEDGLSLDEVLEIEGELSEEEQAIFG